MQKIEGRKTFKTKYGDILVEIIDGIPLFSYEITNTSICFERENLYNFGWGIIKIKETLLEQGVSNYDYKEFEKKFISIINKF